MAIVCFGVQPSEFKKMTTKEFWACLKVYAQQNGNDLEKDYKLEKRTDALRDALRRKESLNG